MPKKIKQNMHKHKILYNHRFFPKLLKRQTIIHFYKFVLLFSFHKVVPKT